jgi:predicted nucleic acid-binding Zn ribbon protein
MEKAPPRLCLECAKPLKGRSDQKFCDDYCRNAYNNRQNADANNYVRNVNNALRRNRRLLEGAIKVGEEMGRVQKQKLAEQGFDFTFHTHSYVNKKSQTYWFTYEYGWLELDEGWLLVVRRGGKEERTGG